jgi:hypothetical protein
MFFNLFRKILGSSSDRKLKEATCDLNRFSDYIFNYLFHGESQVTETDLIIIRRKYMGEAGNKFYKYASEETRGNFYMTLDRLRNLVDPPVDSYNIESLLELRRKRLMKADERNWKDN